MSKSPSKSPKSTSGTAATQLVVPALVGAGVAAAAFGLFVALGPVRAPAPISTALAPLPAMPAPASATPSQTTSPLTAGDDSQKALIEKTVEAYLLNNPQILMRMSEALERQQAAAQNLKVKTVIAENADLIFRDNYGLEAGNPEGDVTIVEFSDYNCPYCKRAFIDVEKLIKADKNIRVVMKEFPIFGERSAGAARVAIAARKQGKYMELHAAMMNNRGANNEKMALRLAEKLGLDMDKLREDMKSDEARKIIEETRDLGNKLGIQGTPFFLIGDRTLPGAPDALFEELQQKVADVRKNGCESGC